MNWILNLRAPLASAVLLLAAAAAAQTVPDPVLIHGDGQKRNRFDIVIMAEGYVQSSIDAGHWADKAKQFSDKLTGFEPFHEFPDHLNVWRLDTVSGDSGVPTGSAQDTFFKLRFKYSSGGHVEWDGGRVNHVKGQLTSRGYDVQAWAMIGNTGRQAGVATGNLAVLTACCPGTFVHEIGHAAFGLADEYVTHTCSNPCPSWATSKPNVTCEVTVAASKWARWADKPSVGDAQGNNYLGNMYCKNLRRRSMSENVMRRSTNPYFGHVNMEEIVTRIYAAMQPIDSHAPSSFSVSLPGTGCDNSGLDFSVATVPNVTVSDTATSIRWTSDLDGAEIGRPGGQPADSTFDNDREFTVSRPCSLFEGEHTVTATVQDHSARVRRTDAVGRRLIATRTWTITRANRPPHAVGSGPADMTAVLGSAALTIDASAHFIDADEDPDADPPVLEPLTYSATSSAASAVTATVSGSTVTVTPKAVGSALITITASDEAASASHQFSVTVTEPKLLTLTAPTGMSTGAWWPVCEGRSVSFTVRNPGASRWFTLVHGSVFDPEVPSGWTPPPGPTRDWDLYPEPMWFHIAKGASATLKVTARSDGDSVDGGSHFRIEQSGGGDGSALARFFVREVDAGSSDRASLCP